jgi:hypothetical protein
MKPACFMSVYVAALILAFGVFRISPFEYHLPPWETWFDSLGLFWGMVLSVSLTLFVMLALSGFITGLFQIYSYRFGCVSCFCFAFVGLLAYYSKGRSGPDIAFQIVVSLIVASLLLLPFSIGYIIKTAYMKRSDRAL